MTMTFYCLPLQEQDVPHLMDY